MSVYEQLRKEERESKNPRVVVVVGDEPMHGGYVSVPDEEEVADVARTETRQLEIYEIHTDDGGVGLKFGDGPIHMGYDESDLMRLLGEIFTGPEHDDRPLDGDLLAVAELYLDEATAQERFEELRG